MDPFEATGQQPTILLVDDDTLFAQALARSLGRRGYATLLATDAEGAMASLKPRLPDYAVVDLRLPDCSGLALVKRLRAVAQDMRIVVLTGYGNIASTVDAIKLGACHYLTKPAHADDVLAALHCEGVELDDSAPPPQAVPSVYRVEWEHIHRVLAEQEGNISESARLLGMHRRTLQRKLGKHPVRR